jgi:HlyD family secretion protein
MLDTPKEDTDPKQQAEPCVIFRDEALAHISTPNDVNKIISVVGSGTWILIAMFVVIAGIALGWLFYGSIPITLQGQGILIPKGGIFKTVTSPEGFNIIEGLPVQTGQIVEKDQIVALLDNPELTKTIAVRTEYVADLKKKRGDLATDAAKSIKEKTEHYEKQKKIIEDSLKTKVDYQKHLETNLEKQRILLGKGYAKQQNVLDIESQLNALKEEDLRSKEKLVQLQKDLLVDQENWTQREREIVLKLTDEERALEDLKTRQETTKTIKSPLRGKVIGIHHKIRDSVAANEPLVTLSQGDETQLDALIYLNPLEGKEVKVGMVVYMIPTHLEKEHVGYIEGEVIEVSPYPETVRSLMSTLQNEELVKKFAESSPPISARVSIKKDHQKNKKSPIDFLKLSPGTWVYGRVIVERRSPFAIIIPAIKKMLEVMP